MQKSQLINGVIIDWNKIDRGSYLKVTILIGDMHQMRVPIFINSSHVIHSMDTDGSYYQ